MSDLLQRPACPPALRRSALGTLALLLAWLCASVQATTLCAEEAPVSSLAEAEAALAAGRFEEARAHFLALLTASGPEGGTDAVRRAPLQRGLASALLGLGLVSEAIEPLEALARQGQPVDLLAYAEALLTLARGWAATEPPRGVNLAAYLADALGAATRARGPAELEGRVARARGEALALKGRTAEALEAFAAQPVGDPPTPAERWALSYRARLLYQSRRFAEAAEVYERAGEIRGAAAAWAAAKDPARALSHYAALLAAAPGDAALLEEAVAAARYAGALDALAELLSQAPGAGVADAALLRARARLEELRGRRAQALALLADALRVAPEEARAKLTLDRVRVLLRDPPDAARARAQAAEELLAVPTLVAIDGTLREAALALAQQELLGAWRAYPDVGPLERSTRLQQAALEGTPGDSLAWANLGNTLRLTADTQRALACFERALALDPADATTRNDGGLALLGAGDRPGAESAFRRALADDPELISALQNLARLRWRAGDDAASRALLERAARAARRTGAPSMLHRFLADRAWRTSRRPDRR